MRKILSDSILDLAKCPNRKTCTFTFMHFPVETLPRSKMESESISHKVLYNYNLKTKFGSASVYI